VVEGLFLDSLPRGRIHECWLHVSNDAFGLPVRLPLLVARGGEGPTVGLTAAVHGDEVNGIAVIHEIFAKLDPNSLRGTVVALPVANASAFHHHSRRTPHGVDLNHHFPGSPDGNDMQIYAHRLLERFIRHLDVLLDLHTASRGRSNCVYVRADMLQSETARMAYLQRPQIILHNPPSDGTLRGAASELGVAAITVEVGNPNRFQKEYIRQSVQGIRGVLAEWRLIRKRPLRLGPPPALCSSSVWTYTDMGGLLTVLPELTERVEEGQAIARLTDMFGHELRTYTAPFSGIVIGRAVDPVATTGARILHLGKLAPEDHRFVRRPDEA
jgi:predicted deacylase